LLTAASSCYLRACKRSHVQIQIASTVVSACRLCWIGYRSNPRCPPKQLSSTTENEACARVVDNVCPAILFSECIRGHVLTLVSIPPSPTPQSHAPTNSHPHHNVRASNTRTKPSSHYHKSQPISRACKPLECSST
jgi:hypothetical protein